MKRLDREFPDDQRPDASLEELEGDGEVLLASLDVECSATKRHSWSSLSKKLLRSGPGRVAGRPLDARPEAEEVHEVAVLERGGGTWVPLDERRLRAGLAGSHARRERPLDLALQLPS